MKDKGQEHSGEQEAETVGTPEGPTCSFRGACGKSSRGSFIVNAGVIILHHTGLSGSTGQREHITE